MLIDTRTKSRAYEKAPKAGPMEGTPLLRLFCLDLALLATLCRGLMSCLLQKGGKEYYYYLNEIH